MRLKIDNIEEYPLNNLTFSWEIILFWCELEFRHVYISRSVSPHGRFWKLNIEIPWLLRSYVPAPAVRVSYKMYVCSYTADFYSFSLKFRTAIYLIMPGLCNSSVVCRILIANNLQNLMIASLNTRSSYGEVVWDLCRSELLFALFLQFLPPTVCCSQ